MILYWKHEDVKNLKTIPLVCDIISNTIENEIQNSFNAYLENPFIINDTKWFEFSSGKLKPRVTNKAEYISKKFQNGLEKYGWHIDHKLLNQEIDGYKEFQISGIKGFTISEENFRLLLSTLHLDDKFLKIITCIYLCNFLKNLYLNPPLVDQKLFQEISTTAKVRVGLEFETGNIASSFRALSKLNFLFLENAIDIGIFITSNSKNVSTRIWPSANRNGSLEELNQRKFLEDIRLPILICGFEPDKWDNTAQYLGNKDRYQIIAETSKTIDLNSGQQKRMLYSEKQKLYTYPAP